MASEAIQVIKSVDQRKKIAGKITEVKTICTVNRYKDGPSLEEVFQGDFEDLPILVFSIAGKTRGGKSFLLNLMIKHLECLERGKDSKNVEQDFWMSGSVPNYFIWKNGSDSVTRGLWIYPKIFRLKNGLDNEVGVMLLDAEGMYDGEATDGEIIAISGISAAISYLQIFNLKDKITTDYLEGVVRSLVKGIEEMDSEGKENMKDQYKLMFVVRDWIGEDDFPFGLNGGHDYVKSEEKRGTKENKELWKEVRNTFSDVKCVLLPHPGHLVQKKQFCSVGDLAMLEEEFLQEIKKFIEDLFKPDNLVPSEPALTGGDIYSILMSADGRTADEDLSFLNVYTEHGNIKKVEEWISDFEKTLDNVVFSRLDTAKSEMLSIQRKAEKKLMGKSRSIYIDKLTNALQESFNTKVVKILFQQYCSSFQDFASVEKQQSAIWPVVYEELQNHLCGDGATRQSADHKFIKDSAAHYYDRLKKEHKRRFVSLCSIKTTLEDCVGLDEEKIALFKECEDFNNDTNNKDLSHAIWLKEYQSLKNEFLDKLIEKVSHLTGIPSDTLKELRAKQYDHFESLTLLNEEWDTINKDDKLMIAKKVGYAMFGLPAHLTAQSASSSANVFPAFLNLVGLQIISRVSRLLNRSEKSKGTGYSKDQESKIWPLVEKITDTRMSEVYFSCIFLCYNSEGNINNLPLFRIKLKEDVHYLDSNCRTYSCWDDFLNSNTLPEVVYCYPLNGSYSKKEGFGVAFARTPATKTETKVLKVADKVGNCVALGAGGVAIVAAAGAAAPVVGVGAMAVGAVAGLYGATRRIMKMVDKKKHGESIKGKDVLNLAANVTAVGGAVVIAAGRFGFVAVEAATLLLGTKIAAGVTTVTTFTVLATDQDDTPELISLMSQIEESLIKIQFYFSATSQEEALEAIRKCLQLDKNSNTHDTLMDLIERNCIQVAVETVPDDMRIEKYASQNVVTLLTGILKHVSNDVREIVTFYCAVQSFGQQFMVDEVKEIMLKFMRKFCDEIEAYKVRFINVLAKNAESFSDDPIYVQTLINHVIGPNGGQLVLAFRFLTNSLISTVRNANNFFNSIVHKAVTLDDHYLSDISFHPLYEITQKMREVVEQTESSIDLESNQCTELDDVILEILKLLIQNSSESWSADQFAQCLISLTEDIMKRSKEIIEQHKKLVTEKENNISCRDLDELSRELGLEGYNYGMSVLKKLFNDNGVDGSAMEKNNVGPDTSSFLIIPAWNGILDHLYFYCCESPVQNKLVLIKSIERSGMDYNEYVKDNNLRFFIPLDEDMCPTFVVYTLLKNNNESGFILLLKNQAQDIKKQHALAITYFK